ncbi:MAG: transketolase C-terminal domain-containing protein, partial [Sphingobium sp.]
EDVLGEWRRFGGRGAVARGEWEARLAASGKGAEFTARMAGELPADTGIAAHIDSLLAAPQKVATRKASELALGPLTQNIAAMIGGSADLTGSNNTKTKSTVSLSKDDYSGRYVNYGIREFGMAAAMNGMALHGGVIPYGGTFLVFSDYARNAIRMSALQRTRVIYVLTHDSIGLGEDGPTHQPIEHVMSMRLIPTLEVFRPADVIETAECWQLALENSETPSVLALTRQNLPQLRDSAGMLSAKGAYTLKAASAERKVVIVATGSEVEIAVAVRDALEADGIGVDVVSMPSMSRFITQDAAYRNDVLPQGVLRVSIEAGTTFGWEAITGLDGLRFDIDSFGASAPAEVLYDHFGLTAAKIAPQIRAALGN